MTRIAPLALAAGLLLLLATPAALVAQDFPSQTLGRGYWHMFAAYAIAWVLVLVWVVSIGRRLSEVERRIEE